LDLELRKLDNILDSQFVKIIAKPTMDCENSEPTLFSESHEHQILNFQNSMNRNRTYSEPSIVIAVSNVSRASMENNVSIKRCNSANPTIASIKTLYALVIEPETKCHSSLVERFSFISDQHELKLVFMEDSRCAKKELVRAPQNYSLVLANLKYSSPEQLKTMTSSFGRTCSVPLLTYCDDFTPMNTAIENGGETFADALLNLTLDAASNRDSIQYWINKSIEWRYTVKPRGRNTPRGRVN